MSRPTTRQTPTTNESQTGIELSDVTYHYPGSNKDVNDFSLTAQPGTLYGLLGLDV